MTDPRPDRPERLEMVPVYGGSIENDCKVIASFNHLPWLRVSNSANWCCQLPGISCLHDEDFARLIIIEESGKTPPPPISNYTNRILRIVANGTGLVGTLPSSLSQLNYTVMLDLTFNNLQGTLEPLSGMVNLRHLYLGKNKFSGTLQPLHALSLLDFLIINDNALVRF
jgi:hypothetical protein